MGCGASKKNVTEAVVEDAVQSEQEEEVPAPEVKLPEEPIEPPPPPPKPVRMCKIPKRSPKGSRKPQKSPGPNTTTN